MTNRRTFIKQSGGLCYSIMLTSPFEYFDFNSKAPKILLVSGWQDVNIGDIAHTPGLIYVLQKYIPNAHIILWKRSEGEEVKNLLNKNFPTVKVVYGRVDQDKNVDNKEVLDAINETDIMIHGSGPLLVGADNLACWLKNTNKPFGVFGTTLQNPNEYHQSILKKASFIFTRETTSIEHLKKAGISGSHIRFAPDATFNLSIHNDEKANEFLSVNKLENKKFICVIPRLRYTPYHTFNKVDWTEERINMVEQVNEEKKETDHAKLREAMIAWVRETKNKVLVCPEMTYQVNIMDELLVDPLPDDVKPYVLKRGYWLPDEAASVYAKAHSVLSFECHSPIIAAANGVPFFYLRQPEDTIKGQMYYDLNFNDWVFEIEETEGIEIANRLREIWMDYSKAEKKLAQSMKLVDKLYQESTLIVKNSIS
jgi:polysaccharide pyruvyl transferase WcaK-like protein